MAASVADLLVTVGADISQLQRSLGQVKTALDGVAGHTRKAAAASAKTWDDYAESVTRAGRNIRQAGTAITIGVSAPLAAMGFMVGKAAINFESAFAGVRKTIDDASPEQLEALRQTIRRMATEQPVGAIELAGIGELGGQLGVPIAAMEKFMTTIAGMTVATNLIAEEAATAFAQISTIMSEPIANVDRMASAVTDLGAKGASSESQIVAMALQIAGTGRTIGLTTPQVFGFAAALANLGIEPEKGGSAISRVMQEIATSVASGGASLELFAAVAGMTSVQFQEAFSTNAANAVQRVIVNLIELQKSGVNVFAVLEQMGFGNIRVTDTLLRSANAAEKFSQTLTLSDTAWAENIALQKEVAKRNETTASQWATMGNQVKELSLQLGDVLLPIFKNLIAAATPFIQTMGELVKWFVALPPGIQESVFAALAFGAALGPVVFAIGSIVTVFGYVMKAIALIKGAAGLAGLGTMLSGLSLGPIAMIVLAIAGIGLAIYGVITHWEELKSAATSIWNSIADTINEATGRITLTPAVTVDSPKKMLADIESNMAGIDAIIERNKVRLPVTAVPPEAATAVTAGGVDPAMKKRVQEMLNEGKQKPLRDLLEGSSKFDETKQQLNEMRTAGGSLTAAFHSLSARIRNNTLKSLDEVQAAVAAFLVPAMKQEALGHEANVLAMAAYRNSVAAVTDLTRNAAANLAAGQSIGDLGKTIDALPGLSAEEREGLKGTAITAATKDALDLAKTNAAEQVQRAQDVAETLTLTGATLLEQEEAKLEVLKAQYEELKKQAAASGTAITPQKEALSAAKIADQQRRKDLSGSQFGVFTLAMQDFVRDTQGGFGLMRQLAIDTAQSMSSSFQEFFFNAMQGKITTLKDLWSSLTTFIQQMASKILAQFATQAALQAMFGTSANKMLAGSTTTDGGGGMFAGFGGKGGLVGMLGGLFGGGGAGAAQEALGAGIVQETLGQNIVNSTLAGLARGGPAMGGRPYLVGEDGPELFVPRGSGTVMPNDKWGGGGGGTTIVMNITTPDTAGFRKSQSQLFLDAQRALFAAQRNA